MRDFPTSPWDSSPSSRCRGHRDTHHPWRHKWISTLGPRYHPPGEATRGPATQKTNSWDRRWWNIYMHNLCTIHNSKEKYMHTFWKSIFCIIVCIIFCLYLMGNRSWHWGDHLFDGDMMGDSWKSKEFGRHSQNLHSGYILYPWDVINVINIWQCPPQFFFLHPRATNGSNIMWLITT